MFSLAALTQIAHRIPWPQRFAQTASPARLKQFLAEWGLTLAVVGVFSLIALGFAVWEDQKYHYVAKRWGTVVPGKIYRSGQISRWKIGDVLDQHQIGVVIDMQLNDPRDAHQQAEVQAVQERGLKLYRLPMAGDGTGDPRRYAEAVAIMHRCEQAGVPVLIHCAAGSQRTGGVVAAYRILVQKRPAFRVYQELRQFGWNPDEDLELVPFLQENLPQLARMLVEKGVIEKIPESFPVVAP